METRPIVFALILGWVTGQENLTPSFVDWLETREAKPLEARVAQCSALGVDFELRQAVLDFSPVRRAESP
jgi:hypothetical protein